MGRTICALLAVTVAAGLAGCKAETDDGGATTTDACGAAGVQHLLGQPETAFDGTAQSGPLRILPPGSAMTMDHRPERLNLDLDDAGRITRIWCG